MPNRLPPPAAPAAAAHPAGVRRRLRNWLALALAAVICGWPAPCPAGDLAAGGAAQVELGLGRALVHDPPLLTGFGLAGLRLRATGGHRVVQYAVGFDWHLGATVPAGLLYSFALQPAGIAFVGRERLRLISTLGVGFDGVADGAPIAARFPLDLSLELDLTDSVQLGAWAEIGWTTAGDSRPAPSQLSPATGELSARLYLRWLKRTKDRSKERFADGLFVGLGYSERFASPALLSVMGYGFDARLWRL